LGQPSLRDATLDDVERIGDEVLARRMRHVVTENERVLAAVRALDAGNWPELGRLFSASHASLRDDFEVSCAELDRAVAAALEAGALGARMTGAGFGGSAIALVPVQRAEVISDVIAKSFADAGFAAPHIFPVHPSSGARQVAA
jgi:galactokinase